MQASIINTLRESNATAQANTVDTIAFQSDLKDIASSMEAAEILFLQNSEKLDEENRKPIQEHLDNAYRVYHTLYRSMRAFDQLPLSVLLNLSRLLHLQARLYYGGQMTESCYFNQTSIKVALLAMHLTDPSCLNFLSNPTFLHPLEANLKEFTGDLTLCDSQLLERNPDEMIKTAAMILSPLEVLRMGSVFRWLGHSFQNLDTYNTATAQNITRFERIYHLSRLFLENAATHNDTKSDATLEIARLLYNTGPFLFDLRYPLSSQATEEEKEKHLQAKIATLDDIEPYLKDNDAPLFQTLRAQRFNLQAVILRSNVVITSEAGQRLLKECYAKVEQALKISDAIDPARREEFVHHVFLNNCASFGMDCQDARAYSKALADRVGVPDIRSTVIGHMITTVIQYVEHRNPFHYYNVTFYRNAARFMLRYPPSQLKDPFPIVLNFLTKAVNICTNVKFRVSTKSLQNPLLEKILDATRQAIEKQFKDSRRFLTLAETMHKEFPETTQVFAKDLKELQDRLDNRANS